MRSNNFVHGPGNYRLNGEQILPASRGDARIHVVYETLPDIGEDPITVEQITEGANELCPLGYYDLAGSVGNLENMSLGSVYGSLLRLWNADYADRIVVQATEESRAQYLYKKSTPSGSAFIESRTKKQKSFWLPAGVRPAAH